jgi:hypothetical protein
MFFIFSFIFARSLVIDGVDSLHHYSVKRDLLQCQKRPTTVSKETYYRSVVIDGVDSLHHYSVKRDLLQGQKRPTTVSKETYYSVKRDLLQECRH